VVVAVLVVAGCAADPAEPPEPEPAPPDTNGDPPDSASGPPDTATDTATGTAATPDVPALHPEIDAWDATVVTLHGASGSARVDARVAAAPEQLRRGLMHVPEVPDGTGMLFVFGEERTGGFWMKDTLVPLDIAFAAADGTIVAILTMTPCTADPCPTYDPEVAYTSALEVPAGWFASAGVEVGDALSWSDPSPDDR
jgi:uncharacterized protein